MLTPVYCINILNTNLKNHIPFNYLSQVRYPENLYHMQDQNLKYSLSLDSSNAEPKKRRTTYFKSVIDEKDE